MKFPPTFIEDDAVAMERRLREQLTRATGVPATIITSRAEGLSAARVRRIARWMNVHTEIHEEVVAARMERANLRRAVILGRNHNSHEEALRAHYLRGEPHPDDVCLPINLWDGDQA